MWDVGAILTPEMLTDLLISNPHKERIDCFSKRQYYDQQLSRYHSKNDSHINASDPILVEAEFLASLYLGYNGVNMTAEQFQELESSIRNAPAQALAKRIPSNGNLNELRKTLFSLDIHQDLVNVLRRKYFPTTYFDTKEVTAGNHLRELDLPDEVARVVKRAWTSAGMDQNTKGTQLIKKTQVHTAELSSRSADSEMGTSPYRLTGSCDGTEETLSKFLEKIGNINNISETELLNIFGLDEAELRTVLQPIARIVIQFFYFVKTGRMLKQGEGATILSREMPQMDLEAIFHDKPVSLPTLLKLLVAIVDYLNNHPFFLFQHVIRVPYNFSVNTHFEIKYDFTDCSFGIFLLHDFHLSNYDSIRLEFLFSFILDQLIDFETNPELKMIAIDCQQQAPPNYQFTELIVHSLIRENFTISQGSKLGKWTILSLETKARFVPLKLPEAIMSKFAQKTAILKTFNLRKTLSDRLSELLLLKQNDVQKVNEGGLHSKQARQLYAASIMQAARVREECVPRDKNNRKSFPYNSLLSKLNAIILGQYFIKSNMSVNAQDMIEIKKSDPYLNGIRLRLEDNYETKTVNSHFVLHQNLLFKNTLVLGEPVLRLCLPELLCANILRYVILLE